MFCKIHSVLMISKNRQRHINISSFSGNFLQVFVIDRIHCHFVLSGFPLLLLSPWSLLGLLSLASCLVLAFFLIPLSHSSLSICITSFFLLGGKNEMKSYSCDQNCIFLSRFLRIVNEAGPFSVTCFIAPCRKPKTVVLYVIVL